MKSFGKLDHFGFFLIRRPTRSIEWLNNFHQKIVSESLEDALMSYFQEDKSAREAINIASASLHDRLLTWLNGDDVSEKKQLLLTLYKYVIRSGSRCTPFGLFSCSATGSIMPGCTNNSFDVGETFMKLSLSMETSMAICHAIERMNLLRTRLTLVPNTSIYNASGKLRYVERLDDGATKNFFITSVEKNATMELVLDHCESGSTFTDVVALLETKGFSHNSSVQYTNDLIENQIIQFDIKPTISGGEYLQFLLSKLPKYEDAEHVVSILRQISEMLDSRPSLYLEEEIKMLMGKLDIHTFGKPIFKVDSFFLDNLVSISSKLVEEIQDAMNRLTVLNRSPLPQSLRIFKENFSKTYEDREIPLGIALDDEIGIGYGPHRSQANIHLPLIDDLCFVPDETEPASLDTWMQQFVIDKYLGSVIGDAAVVQLSEADIEEISSHKTQDNSVCAASSYYAFGNILAGSDPDLEQRKTIFNLLACQGPSAVNMMSRFSDGIPGLRDKLHEIARREEEKHPDIIFAEIIHLHEAKAGNIMARPNLYQYEIPYLGQASVKEEFRITIDDLMVSVRNNQIILRSKRLNKRVVPRLSNMHNYYNGLPVYQFLSGLQEQDSNFRIAWDWGILNRQSHLPRVTYRNIIVSRATWHIDSKRFKGKAAGEIRTLLENLKLPPRFVVSSGDNELLIDINVQESITLLTDIFKKNEKVRVKEFLGEPEDCVVTSHGERFVSEFVIPLFNVNASAHTGFSKQHLNETTEHYTIGSEWFYLKIYQGEKAADSLLTEVVYPLVMTLMRDKVINQFFFVRYKDPQPHIRLRFKGDPSDEFHSKVWQLMLKAADQHIRAGIITSIRAETYFRELERYGWQLINFCEPLFDIDSLETLAFLFVNNADEESRLLYAAKKIHTLFEEAEYPFEVRHAFFQKMKDYFFINAKGDTALRRKMNEKYNFYQAKLKEILEYSVREESEKSFFLKKIMTSSNNTVQLETIFSSLVHMSINRIFTSKHHKYELLIYHFLFKYYDSLAARMKNMPIHILPDQI